MLLQAQSEDDDEAGENVPMNITADGGKFMEEFFEQVGIFAEHWKSLIDSSKIFH